MSIVETVLNLGGDIVGGYIGQQANDKAADQAIAGQERGFQIASDRYAQGGDIRAKGIKKAADYKITGVNQSEQALLGAQQEAETELLQYEQQAADIAKAGMAEAARLASLGYHEQAAQIEKGVQQQVAALNEKITSVKAGAAEAKAKYDDVAAKNESGTTYMRETVGRGDALTQDQQYALDESRRTTGNTLRSSGFAGSGRTAAALLNKVEVDQKMGFMGQNRQAAQAAASQMAGAGNAATAASAATSMQTGQLVGAAQGEIGAAQASGAEKVGAAYLGARNVEAQGKLGEAEIGATSARRVGDIKSSSSLGQGNIKSQAASSRASERAQRETGVADAKAAGIEKPTGIGVEASRQSGQYAANATTSNAGIQMDTIGGIGSYLNSKLKDANVDEKATA